MDKTKFPQNAEVQSFKENILKTAEELVVNKFPKRIIQLNKLLTSGKLTSHPSSVYQKINIPIPESSLTATTSSKQATTDQKNDNKSFNGENGVSLSDNLKNYLTYHLFNQRWKLIEHNTEKYAPNFIFVYVHN